MDDTDLTHSNLILAEMDIEQLMEDAQEAINCWEGGLK